jgi:hypothetical protein
MLLARHRSALAEPLLAQTKAFDNLAIPIRVTTVEVIQKSAPLVDHHDQPASRSMVLQVQLQMRRQIVDAVAQQCNLDFRRAGILHILSILLDQH